jgi:hypothetical protein
MLIFSRWLQRKYGRATGVVNQRASHQFPFFSPSQIKRREKREKKRKKEKEAAVHFNRLIIFLRQTHRHSRWHKFSTET